MDNINDHLKACRPDADVYTYSFTKAEVEAINEGLKKKSWTEEVRDLLKEEKQISKRNITLQIQDCCENICDNFCKYRETCDDNCECEWIRQGNNCPLDAIY